MIDVPRHLDMIRTEYMFYNADDKNGYMKTMERTNHTDTEENRTRLTMFFDYSRGFEEFFGKDVGDYEINNVYEVVIAIGQPTFYYLRNLLKSLREYQDWRIASGIARRHGNVDGTNIYNQIRYDEVKLYAYDMAKNRNIKELVYIPEMIRAMKNQTDAFILAAISRDAGIGREGYRKIAMIRLDDIDEKRNEVVYSDGSVINTPLISKIAMGAFYESTYYEQDGGYSYRYRKGCPYLLKPRENASANYSPDAMYVLARRRIDRLLDILGKTPEEIAFAGAERHCRDLLAKARFSIDDLQRFTKQSARLMERIGDDPEMMEIYEKYWAELSILTGLDKLIGLSGKNLKEELKKTEGRDFMKDCSDAEAERIKKWKRLYKVFNSHGVRYKMSEMVRKMNAFYKVAGETYGK